MGRANVYLPDDLERRVKAARLPVSEICQRALLAAVEAAEGGLPGFSESITAQFHRGWEAAVRWIDTAPMASLLTLLRDQRLEEVPAELLPEDLYALTDEQTLAWEAGFMAAGRATIRLPLPVTGSADAQRESSEAGTESDEDSRASADAAGGLGDDADCRIGVTLDGHPVSFDPHAAVRAGKSPLFAILGESEHRARLALSVAQDAAARGVGVVLLDLSGQLVSRAAGLGKNVRVVRRAQAPLPGFEEFVHGAVGLGGLWETVGSLSRGSGLADLLGGGSSEDQIEPGYVTVIGLPRDNQIGAALSAVQVLTQFRSRVDFPRMLQVDLGEGMGLPAGLASRLGGITRFARQQNVAVGLAAAGAGAVAQIAGSGAQLSTVIAFATSNPVEADRLRGLMGAGAPILVNPPGTSSIPSDETWAVMRDLQGRFGQVRMEGW
ncbi:MAG: hypothetical protein ACJ74U_06240 [Jatrophihabitantaceae bacterium]